MKVNTALFENMFRFIKDHKSWFIYSALLLIILLGVFIRVQPLSSLVDPTTGKYISLELDSTLFYRYAQDLSLGKFDSIDMLRSAPLGQPVGFFGAFTSYFVYYIWSFLQVFSTVSVEFVDIIYPIIAMAIMSLFLFLLLRKIFNWKVGLLVTLIINIIPSFLFRSLGGSSDHDILGMMFFVMALFFYVYAYQDKTLWKKLLLAAVAALLTFLATATAGSGLFLLTIIGLSYLSVLLMNKFEKENFYVYFLWFVLFNILLLISGRSITGYVLSLSTFLAYFVFFVSIFYYLIIERDYLKIRKKVSSKLPEGLFSILSILILGVTFIIVFFGFNQVIDSVSKMYYYIFHAFQYGRIGLTVAENRKPYVVDWFSQFGWVYVLLFVSGAIMLFYKLVKPIKKLTKNLTIAFMLFIILYIFSRFSSTSILDGESLFSRILFLGSIIGFALYSCYIYFNAYYHDKETFEQFSLLNNGYLIILIWFLIMAIAATTAVRLFFEFSPTTVIMAAVTLVFLFDYLVKQNNNYIKYVGIAIIFLVLFSPFSFAQGIAVSAYQTSYNQARYSSPGYDQQWQLTGKWVRENTNSTDVFVHWWDYGYWVQSGFQRATVTDGGHPYAWWDYLVARDVLTATTFEEPLNFLKAHNVSYLLILKDEIGKYPAYSSIGGDVNDDRSSYIATFSLDPQSTQEKRNTTQIIYKGQFVLDEDLVYGGKVYAKGQSAILAVSLLMKNVQNENGSVGFNFEQPQVILYSQSYTPQTLKLQCIYLNGKEYSYETYDFPGCFKTIPVYSGYQQQSPIGAGLFLSKRVYSSLFAKLYLLNKENPYYKLAYSDEKNVPLAIYNGQLIGPMRIWQVNYPTNLVLTKEELNYNLRTTYPDGLSFNV